MCVCVWKIFYQTQRFTQRLLMSNDVNMKKKYETHLKQ